LALTRQEKRDAQAAFADGKACPDCGGLHQRACNRVRRQVWLRTGAGAGERTEVEYWRTWDDSAVIWPEDAYDPDDPDDAEDASGR
jgi:hypothetical protein